MREVLVLREVERMTDDEIGALIGMAADSVRMLFLRAAAALGRALGCSPSAALEAYRRWPIATAPMSDAHALAVAQQRLA